MSCKLRSRFDFFFLNPSACLLVWFVYLNCQPVCLLGLYFCLSVCLPAWLFVSQSVCLFARLSLSPFTSLFTVYLPVYSWSTCLPASVHFFEVFTALYISPSFPNWENILNSWGLFMEGHPETYRSINFCSVQVSLLLSLCYSL